MWPFEVSAQKKPPVCEGTFGNDCGSLRTSPKSLPSQEVTAGHPLATIADDSQNLALEVVKFQSSQDCGTGILLRSKHRPRRAGANGGLPPDDEPARLACTGLDRQWKHWPLIMGVGLLPVLVVLAVLAINSILATTIAVGPAKVFPDMVRATQGQGRAAGTSPTGSFSVEGQGFLAPAWRQLSTPQALASKCFSGKNLSQSGYSRSFPVVTGYGGRQPGQILDKFAGPFLLRGSRESGTLWPPESFLRNDWQIRNLRIRRSRYFSVCSRAVFSFS